MSFPSLCRLDLRGWNWLEWRIGMAHATLDLPGNRLQLVVSSQAVLRDHRLVRGRNQVDSGIWRPAETSQRPVRSNCVGFGNRIMPIAIMFLSSLQVGFTGLQ